MLASQIEQSRVAERSIVRTWGLRGTLHLLTADDLSWLVPLIAPVFIAGDKKRRQDLGLDEQVCQKGLRLIREILTEHGALTRAELVNHLANKGLILEGQATYHLLFYCAYNGLICFGAERDNEPT